jgi:hypothetical protein
MYFDNGKSTVYLSLIQLHKLKALKKVGKYKFHNLYSFKQASKEQKSASNLKSSIIAF